MVLVLIIYLITGVIHEIQGIIQNKKIIIESFVIYNAWLAAFLFLSFFLIGVAFWPIFYLINVIEKQ